MSARSATLTYLLDTKVLDEEVVSAAEGTAAAEGGSVLQTLVTSGALGNVDVVRANTITQGLKFVELTDYDINPNAAGTLPVATARRHNVIPLDWEDGALLIAVSSSQSVDLALRDDLARTTENPVVFVVAMKADIANKINAVYRAETQLQDLAAEVNQAAAADTTFEYESMGDVTSDAPVVKFVQLLLEQAVADGASDIHVEPSEHDLQVRFRIDGVLKESNTAPKSLQNAVTSRLKIMSSIDIADTRKPQDGRLSMTHAGKKVDMRVATLPTVHGENVTLRILDNSTAKMSLNDLGFTPANLERYRRSFTKPYGMIILVGQTGSGKSTTAYSTINVLKNSETKFITVENPVEYRIDGITQVQVNDKAGLTFATALRSILRSDPDKILIGEVRDEETAQIAIESALTGHLVITTLHASNAPSAVTRLVEMGIEPYLVGSSVDCVVAQRLCRKLCTRCREAYEPSAEELLSLADFPYNEGDPVPTMYRPVGCNHCKNGYRGRVALHEVMTVTEEIARLTVGRADASTIGRAARADGMKTLLEDGWGKALTGLTAIPEVIRVVVVENN